MEEYRIRKIMREEINNIDTGNNYGCLWIILLLILFVGEPDLYDAIVTFLTK
jgi:hypothetical protein